MKRKSLASAPGYKGGKPPAWTQTNHKFVLVGEKNECGAKTILTTPLVPIEYFTLLAILSDWREGRPALDPTRAA